MTDPINGPKTPLVSVHGNVFLKCEFLHPGRSHKARVASHLLDCAEQAGQIIPKRTTILERTGGNLGIALAVEGKVRGYPIHLVTDSSYSMIKKNIASNLGARVIDRGVEFPHAANNGEVIDELLQNPPAKTEYFYLNQFANSENVSAHENGTGTEILTQLKSQGVLKETDLVLVKGLGTGASMRGIQNTLSNWFRSVKSIAIEPPGCDILKGHYVEHPIQGIGVGMSPPFYDTADLHSVVKVCAADAIKSRDELICKYRFHVGPSSASNYSGVCKVAGDGGFADNTVFISVLYDRGEDYTDSDYRKFGAD